ncbi:MAG: hypothetical protein JSV80_10530, partial [Acidobacteriota bacterium]
MTSKKPARGTTTRTKNPASGVRPPSSTSTAISPGRWIARSGAEAINATERLICGRSAVRSLAVAEGLALTGERAATLLTERCAPAC